MIDRRLWTVYNVIRLVVHHLEISWRVRRTAARRSQTTVGVRSRRQILVSRYVGGALQGLNRSGPDDGRRRRLIKFGHRAGRW